MVGCSGEQEDNGGRVHTHRGPEDVVAGPGPVLFVAAAQRLGLVLGSAATRRDGLDSSRRYSSCRRL